MVEIKTPLSRKDMAEWVMEQIPSSLYTNKEAQEEAAYEIVDFILTSLRQNRELLLGKPEVIPWMMTYKNNNWSRTKYCPACGSENIEMPNDLVEWRCNDCGCWWSIP